MARRQILLHASQQFLEGDVVHWFHLLQDGRTGFVGRTPRLGQPALAAPGPWSSTSGRPATIRSSTSGRPTSSPSSRSSPCPPARRAWASTRSRSTREDTVYRHCLRAIDLVLDQRMGAHGLPLMGTGDWNDGLDEIGSEGRGESVWLGFFLYYILDRMIGDRRAARKAPRGATTTHGRLDALKRGHRADLAGRPLPPGHPRRRHRDRREGERRLGDRRADGRLGRDVGHQSPSAVGSSSRRPSGSSRRRRRSCSAGRRSARTPSPISAGAAGIPKGVRENGMYCHGVQWLVGAARILAEQAAARGRRRRGATAYLETAYRLWLKISPIPHAVDGRDRDLRRPAEQAGGRHGDDVRPGPDDLERLHRRGGLDVPPGPRRRARPAAGGRRGSSPGPTSRPRATSAWSGSHATCTREPAAKAPRSCDRPRELIEVEPSEQPTPLSARTAIMRGQIQ